MANAKWALEPSHSELTFKVRHMMISNVSGRIKNFESTIEAGSDDFTDAKITLSADIDSLSTESEQRDGHLKSPDFFDVANHPKLTFESTKLEKVGGEDYKLHGNLTLRGVTKPVTLNVEYGGTIKDPYGLTRAGFTVDGKINRKDFGLNWSAVTEAGGLVVGDDVKLQAHVEYVKS